MDQTAYIPFSAPGRTWSIPAVHSSHGRSQQNGAAQNASKHYEGNVAGMLSSLAPQPVGSRCPKSLDASGTGHIVEDQSSESKVVSEDEENNSALEYARKAGLTQNYLSIYPLGLIYGERSALFTASEALDFDDRLASDVGPVHEEKIEIGIQSAQLLQSVIQPPFVNKEDLDHMNYGDQRQMRRFELPVTKSDHEVEFLRFAADRFKRTGQLKLRYLNLDELRFPELGDDNADFHLSDRVLPDLEAEVLTLSQDTLMYMKEAFEDPMMPNEEQDIQHQLCVETKVNRIRHVTPPLSPARDLRLPTTPPFPREQAEPWSEQSVFADVELNRLAAKSTSSLEDPAPVSHSELTDFRSLVDTPEIDMSGSPPVTKIIELNPLGVEVPIFSASQSTDALSKARRVPLTANSCSTLPDQAYVGQIQVEDNFSNEEFESIFDRFIDLSTCRPIGSGDVSLDTPRSARRCEVIDLPCYKPSRPWQIDSKAISVKQTSLFGQSITLFNTAVDGRRIRWSGLSKLERVMPWSPFNRNRLFPRSEDFIADDDGYLTELLQALEADESLDSNLSVLRDNGLQTVFQLPEEEDLLEPASSSDVAGHLDLPVISTAPLTMFAPLQDHPLEDTGRVSPFPMAQRMLEHKKITKHSKSRRMAIESSLDRKDAPLFAFDAVKALHGFLATRGLRSTIRPDNARGSESHITSTKDSEDCSVTENAITASTPEPPEPSLCLHLPAPCDIPKRQYIFATTLYRTHRKLIRKIEALYPAIDIIAKDYTSSDDVLLDGEADITISAARGILLTTLQRIKQRPLPGQEGSSWPLRERLKAVASRYENLTLLVAGDKDISSVLASRDKAALSDLSTFILSLPTDVRLTHVPGNDVHLAQWIVHVMTTRPLRSAPRAEALALLPELNPDETAEEIFLRRAGLNAYAAQTILASLAGKKTARNSNESGLERFWKMSKMERIERFENVMGGSWVLGRVSDLLERKEPLTKRDRAVRSGKTDS